MINTIFFDFDGVIAESVDIKTNAFAKLFEREGKTIVEKIVEYHRHNTGVSRYDKFRYFYREILGRPLPDDEFQRLCDMFSALVTDEVVRAPYVKGALEFLQTYSPRYSSYIVSATPQQEMEDIVARRKIGSFFKKIYGSPIKKEAAVKETLNNENILPENAVYIGDAKSDYEAAVLNGVHFIARTGENDPVFKDIPCRKIYDLTPLHGIIQEL